MKRFMILITVIASACMLYVPPAYSQTDSNLVWDIGQKFKTGVIKRLDLSPDNKFILVSRSDDFYVNIGDIIYVDEENGNIVDSIKNVGIIGCFSEDNKYIYTYFQNNIENRIINKINLETKMIEKNTHFTADADSGEISGLGILPDGNLIATIYGGNYLFYIIDGNTMEILEKINKPENCFAVYSMCISPKGDFMVLYQVFRIPQQNGPPVYKNEVNIWDIKTKKYARNLPGEYPELTFWKFFPEGKRLGIVTGWKFKIIDINNLDSVIITDNAIAEFVFSNNNNIIYLGYWTNEIRALNSQSYYVLCSNGLFSGSIPSNILLTKDESYLIVANTLSATFIKIKNCIYNTSVDENNKIPKNILFPNPGTETFTYLNQELIDSSYPYEISGSSGLILSKNKILMTEGKGTFSVENIPSGSFRFKLYAKDKIFSLPFIIER